MPPVDSSEPSVFRCKKCKKCNTFSVCHIVVPFVCYVVGGQCVDGCFSFCDRPGLRVVFPLLLATTLDAGA